MQLKYNFTFAYYKSSASSLKHIPKGLRIENWVCIHTQTLPKTKLPGYVEEEEKKVFGIRDWNSAL